VSPRPSPIDRALVLTAGLGTRLRPLTDVRAKPAIPVAGEPMIRRIVRWLVSRGVADLVLNLHHLPHTLTAVVGDGADLGARVRYSWEQPRVLGSGGGPRLALPLVSADPFFIINGDTLTDVDLGAIAQAHSDSAALVTLALVPNTEFERYGGVLLNADRHVTGFVRRGPGAKGSYHFIGVQVARRAAFASLTRGEPASSIGGVYDTLMTSKPGAVRGFVCDAEFFDVGTTDDYRRTSAAFATREGHAGSTIGQRAQIHPTARIINSILWDDVAVGADAVIEDCIVTDGASIASGSTHRQCVVTAAD
jgi:mannose-1-phosphate guanylyltransferase